MFNKLVWMSALLLTLGTAACGDDDDNVTFGDLDQTEEISNLTSDEYNAFCEWAVETDTMALQEPFMHMVSVDTCLDLDKPDCALSLFVDCAETLDASSTACGDYRTCTATTYPAENRPCSSNPTECPEDDFQKACNHYRYTNGAWVMTTGEPVDLCIDTDHDYPCLCHIKNEATLPCDFNHRDYSSKAKEGNCFWNPVPDLFQ